MIVSISSLAARWSVLWREGPPRRPREWRRAAFLLAAACAPLLLTTSSEWPGLNGDEPHYVVMAESLRLDHDLNLAGDYTDGRLEWLQPEMLVPHVKPGAAVESGYSFHGPGLAFLLLPFHSLDPRPPHGLRLLGVVCGFMLGLGLMRAVHAIDTALPALPITILVLLTAPVLFNTPHLFPDLPAAAVAVWVWVLASGGTASRGRAIAGGILLAILPWLHFKFLLLWAVLLVLAVIGGLRGGRSQAAALASLAVLGPLALCTWNLVTFGSFSPTAAAAYPEVIAAADSPLLAYLSDPLGALRTGLGLLLDQKDGLLAYAPHLLLAAAGAGWLWRRNRLATGSLAVVFGAVWLPTALSQNTGLWGPPGRWLLAVSWILGLLAGIGIFVPTTRAWLRRWRGALLGTTAVVTLLYARHPALLYVDRASTRSPLLQYLGGPGLEVWNWFPLWTRLDSPIWGVTLAWLVVVAVAAAWLWRLGSGEALKEPARTPVAVSWRAFVASAGIAVVAAVLLASASPIGGPEVVDTRSYERVQVHLSTAPATRAWPHPTTLWFGGSDEVTVWISTARPLRWIELDLLAPTAQTGSVTVGDATETVAMAAGEARRLRLEPSTTRYWNGRAYTRLVVRTESGISAGELPGATTDSRWLGLNLRFADLRLQPLDRSQD